MTKKTYIFIILVILSFCIAACNHTTAIEDTTHINEYSAISNQPVSIEKVEGKSKLDFSEGIEKISNSDSTRYSLYAAFPDDMRLPYIYQSSSMRSASMIKVFILAKAMEDVRNGAMDMNEPLILDAENKVGGAGVIAGYASGTSFSLDKIMRLMITESDNTATNMLIDRLGMDNINEYIKRNGYHDTILQRKMMDMQAVKEGRENYTSVNDLGNFFVKLYKHELVGYEQDEKMIEYLKRQSDTECFPSALPNSIIAHKTGELIGLYDDGGIIYTGNKNIVLVIMTESYSSRNIAIHNMKKMARYVVDDRQ